MSKHANPTLIGAFVLGAVALAVITILLMAGGQWFQERRQHMVYFEGEAQGLQAGAPVMFLGVKVGTVKRIQLGLDEDGRRFLVPVTIEVDASAVQTRHGEQLDLRDPVVIRQLVDRGLRARLRMQSLLTGQLYVDLDFYLDKPARFMANGQKVSEIPSIPTTVEELSLKLEDFPMDTFLTDMAAIVKAINTMLSSAAIQQLPVRIEATLKNLESVSALLESEGGPLLSEIRTDLSLGRDTLIATGNATLKMETAAGQVGSAAEAIHEAARIAAARTGSTAEKIATTADKIGLMADRGSLLFTTLNTVSADLAAAARTMQNLTTEESPTVQKTNAMLQEIARAARALRQLAETIEQQPDALIRGKHPEENQ